MKNLSIYTDEIWASFAAKVINADKLKTYKHFDHIFDFARFGEKIKDLVSDPTLKKIHSHSFVPHVKVLTKTPRYKFDEQLDSFELETKIRPISFSSHFDSYIYSFYSYALTEKYQAYVRAKGFDSVVLAYRSDLGGDSNIQFAKSAFDAVSEMIKKHGSCVAIGLDITGYFDNIDHALLKNKWCEVIEQDELPIDQYKIFKSLTKYSYVGKASLMKHFNFNEDKQKWSTLLDIVPNSIIGRGYKEKMDLIRRRGLVVRNNPKNEADGSISHRGIPQGSPMSAVLSNIYLLDFDKWLYTRSKYMGFRYFRYCDDLLIICKPGDAEILNADIVGDIKAKYKLRIQEKKTELIEFRPNSSGAIRGFNIKTKNGLKTSKATEQRYYKNLQYLGFEFNGSNIYVRPGSLSRYFRKAKGRIIKTMMMAYGSKSSSDKIFKKQMFERYSHFGKRNFITYAQNASKKEYTSSSGITRSGMDSVSIKRQLSSHFAILQKEILKASGQFAANKKLKLKR